MAGPKKPEAPSGTSGIELIVFLILLTAIIPLLVRFLFANLSPWEILLNTRSFFAIFFVKYLIWFKLISVILSGLFLWGIIYIISKTNYFIDARGEDLLDLLGGGYKFKFRVYFRWKQIQDDLKSSNSQKWKKAVTSAENIFNDILKMSGYLGSKLDDKMELLTPAQVSNLEDIKRVHALWKGISQDPTQELTQEQAKEIVEVYKKSFVEFGLVRED